MNLPALAAGALRLAEAAAARFFGGIVRRESFFF